MDTPSPNARRLTWLYILALSVVAALSILGQVLVQHQLSRQANDSHVVNIAGRQRMLSQKLIKTALQLSTPGTDDTAGLLHSEIERTQTEWKANHLLLRNGKAHRTLQLPNSDRVEDMFAQLDPAFHAISLSTNQIAQLTSDQEFHDTQSSQTNAKIRAARELMLNSDSDYLQGMNGIVYQYAREARQRVEALQRVEISLLLTTLVVLLAEGFLVFRPAAKRIGLTEERLQRATKQLRHAKEEAESATRTKARFLANVSHELRTPMNAIIGMTELARLTDDHQVRTTYLSNVDEAAQSLLGLLDDLIETSRSDIAEVRLHSAPFTPRDLVEQATRLLQPSAEERQLALRCQVDDDVPEQVVGDAARIRQVLVNLVGNAIKYTEEGSIDLLVSVDESSVDWVAVRFAVQDTGIGISADQQVRIFDEFTQVMVSDGQHRGGVGLGLSICKHLVERMQGYVTVQSRPGEGSVFSFTLPLQKVLCTADKNDAQQKQQVIHPLQVLVVDDAPLNRTITSELLKQLGHVPTAIEDAEKALQEYRDGTYDVVFLDIQMPGMTGYELARYMQKMDTQLQRERAPIVALTAYPMQEYRQKSIDAGMSAHLVKPIRLEDLQTAIRSAVRRSKVETQHKPTATSRENTQLKMRKKLIEVFLQNSPRDLGDLNQAVKDSDSSQVELLAHRLRGQFATLGETDIAGRLAIIERCATTGEAASYRDRWATCLPLIDRVTANLNS